MKISRFVLPAIVAAWIPVACSAQPKPQPAIGEGIVDAKLIADVSSVQPGKPFRAGVLYKIKPEWHIYWKNPGESGFATEIKWSSPQAGVKFGEVQYPAPIKFETPGGDEPITSYGYDTEVLLFSEVTVPEGAGAEVELVATSKWLMCADKCIPKTNQKLTLKLPVKEAKPGDTDVFSKYAAQVPGASDVKPTVKVDKVGDDYVATITADLKGQKIAPGDSHAPGLYFYPDSSKGYVQKAPVVEKLESGKPAVIKVTYTPSEAGAPVPAVSGVLVYTPEGGKRTGVVVKQ